MDDIEYQRKSAIARLQKRAELRSINEEEDSSVISVHAQSVVKKESSSPPPSGGPLGWLFSPLVVLVKLVPESQRLWPVLLAIGSMIGAGAAYAAHRLGLF
jgi:hypothetical protein